MRHCNLQIQGDGQMSEETAEQWGYTSPSYLFIYFLIKGLTWEKTDWL